MNISDYDSYYDDDDDDDVKVDLTMISMADVFTYGSDRMTSLYRQPRRHDNERNDRMLDLLMTSHINSDRYLNRWAFSAHKPRNYCNAPQADFEAEGVAENSWQKRHPSLWTNDDVLDLIYFVASASTSIDATSLSGEKFQDIDGHSLPLMTREEFVERDPRYGELLYDTVHELLDKSQFTPPDDLFDIIVDEKPEIVDMACEAPPCDVSDDDDYVTRRLLPKPVEDLMMDADVTEVPGRCYLRDNDEAQPLSLATVRRYGNNDDVMHRSSPQPRDAAVVRICGHAYDIDSAADFHCVLTPRSATALPADRHQSVIQPPFDIPRPVYTDLSLSTLVSAGAACHASSHQAPIDLRKARTPAATPGSLLPVAWSSHPGDWRLSMDADHMTSVHAAVATTPSPPTSKRKCHGGVSKGMKRSTSKKSRSVSRGDDENSPTEDDNADGTGITSGGRHLWEFIRDLLKAGDLYSGGTGTVLVPGTGLDGGPKHVPIDSIIRWENRNDGVFRIIDSKTVAVLWGRRKHNQTMTYEKLSRALRWCRKNNFFASLPKDAGYPKKLCFKFGPLANNWKEN